MELKVKSYAGTLDSSDVYVIVEPNGNNGIDLTLQSTVLDQYGEDIKSVIYETLKSMGVDSVKINVEDKGALDVVIKSRLQTALMRSAESKNFRWE